MICERCKYPVPNDDYRFGKHVLCIFCREYVEKPETLIDYILHNKDVLNDYLRENYQTAAAQNFLDEFREYASFTGEDNSYDEWVVF